MALQAISVPSFAGNVVESQLHCEKHNSNEGCPRATSVACTPRCATRGQHEAPLLQATWQRVQSQGIIFLGIDFQDDHSEGLNFLHTYGITYLNVVDDTGSTAINYGVTGVPETFFLNRQGVIVSHVIGELTEQTMQSNLQMILRST